MRTLALASFFCLVAAAAERPVAVVACFLAPNDKDSASCAEVARRLQNSGFAARMIPLGGRNEADALQALPVEGDPFFVVVRHGEVQNGRHELLMGDDDAIDSEAFLKAVERRNPRTRLWFESCFAGHLKDVADPKTCIGTGCRGDELNYFESGQPSETMKPLLALLDLSGAEFRRRSGGGCEITASMLQHAYEVALGEGDADAQECIVNFYDEATEKIVEPPTPRIKAFGKRGVDPAGDKRPLLSNREIPPDRLKAMDAGIKAAPVLAAAQKACDDGPLRGATKQLPSEFRYVVECGEGPAKRRHVFESFLPDKAGAQRYAPGCQVLDLPYAERRLAETAIGKRYRNGTRSFVFPKQGIAAKPGTVPVDESRTKFTARDPKTTVPKAPVEKLGWLELWNRQRSLAGVATPWVERFALRHPGCERERMRTPGISGKSGLQSQEKPGNNVPTHF